MEISGRSSMAAIDSDTINEVILAAAHVDEENTLDMRKRKLESIQFQREVTLDPKFSPFPRII